MQKVTWQGKMTFTGTADTGFQFPLGTDPAVGGDNDGTRPMELIAMGLAGCTAMDVISILQKKRQDVTASRCRVNTERAAEHPKVFTSVTIDYLILDQRPEVDQAAVRGAVELSGPTLLPGASHAGQGSADRVEV